MRIDGYEVRHVRGHVEVYKDGEFYCSADTVGEAYKEVLEDES